jgi:hypothetical protein
MSGGEISGNTSRAVSGGSSCSAYSYGGGVYSAGTFTMYGGLISGNTVSSSSWGNTASYGGGVYGNFIKTTGSNGTSGIIYGSDATVNSLKNTAGVSGDAVYCSSEKYRNTTVGETVSLSSGNTDNWIDL